MNPNEPYYPDERNSGITQRNKLIFDIYVKSCNGMFGVANVKNLEYDFEKLAEHSIILADILIEQLKKEEKQ